MLLSQALKNTITWKTINFGLVFLVNVMMVRLLGVEASGMFGYSIAWLSLFILISSASLESGLTYFASRRNTDFSRLFVLLLILLPFQALIAFGLFHLVKTGIPVGLAVAYITGFIAINSLTGLFAGIRSFRLPLMIIAGINLCLLAVLIYLYSTGKQDMAGPARVIFLFIAAVVIQALFLFLYGIRPFCSTTLNLKDSPELLKNVFQYSLIAFAGNILFFLVSRVDYYFVERYCDPISLSNYVQVSRMGQIMVVLPSMIASVIFPFRAGSEKEDFLSALKYCCRFLTVLFFLIAILFILTGQWLFPFLYGKGFDQMYAVMLWYLPGFFCLGIVTVLAAHLAGSGMIKENLLASLFSLLVMIAGDIFLVPRGGIIAAAMVSSVAYLVCLAFLLRIYKKKKGCAPLEFFRIRGADFYFYKNIITSFTHKHSIENTP